MQDYRPDYRQYEMPILAQVLLSMVTLFAIWFAISVLFSF
jgi:hypothetical protein